MTTSRRRALLCFALVACSGEEPELAPDATPGDPEVLVGGFAIKLEAGDDATSVSGAVYDGPQPATVRWEASVTDGPCALLVPSIPFCSEPCGGSAACVADDVCQAYPAAQAAGVVHVSGLGDATFDMEAIAGNYQPPAGVELPNPAFGEGDAIQLVAEGSDAVAGFTLGVSGIAELVLREGELALEREQPLELAWTPGAGAESGSGSGASIDVKLDISHHGGTRGKIECVADDTGSLRIAATLITPLLDLGAAGFPTVIVRRVAVDSVVIAAGRVDLELSSKVEQAVTVPGIESCNDDDDCEAPATCRDDLTCG